MGHSKPRCLACKTPLQGHSDLCVRCFALLALDCPDCTRKCGDMTKVRRNGKGGPHVNCKRCGNRRYVIDMAAVAAARDKGGE